ncbi:MAG: hypothetical protein J7L21_04310 [Sulfurimonas sp.]|nr:hypothetical protein [Sulfurimonas sp.]
MTCAQKAYEKLKSLYDKKLTEIGNLKKKNCDLTALLVESGFSGEEIEKRLKK